MYIKSFYAIAIGFACLLGQVLILINCERSPLALTIMFVLTVAIALSLYAAHVLQTQHDKLNRMHKSYAYHTWRRAHGYSI